MKKLSERSLLIIRNGVFALGIVVGFVIWCFLPKYFQNTNMFHVGNDEYGSKYGVLLLLLLPLFTFLPTDYSSVEVHTNDPEERAKLEAENRKKSLEIQAFRAIGYALLIIVLMIGFLIATR